MSDVKFQFDLKQQVKLATCFISGKIHKRLLASTINTVSEEWSIV